jgi:hypothetical protein
MRAQPHPKRGGCHPACPERKKATTQLKRKRAKKLKHDQQQTIRRLLSMLVIFFVHFALIFKPVMVRVTFEALALWLDFQGSGGG